MASAIPPTGSARFITQSVPIPQHHPRSNTEFGYIQRHNQLGISFPLNGFNMVHDPTIPSTKPIQQNFSFSPFNSLLVPSLQCIIMPQRRPFPSTEPTIIHFEDLPVRLLSPPAES
jgi:hypothetical protein